MKFMSRLESPMRKGEAQLGAMRKKLGRVSGKVAKKMTKPEFDEPKLKMPPKLKKLMDSEKLEHMSGRF